MLNYILGLFLEIYLFIGCSIGATINNVDVVNSTNKSIITYNFNQKPVYTYVYLHNPERIVLNLENVNVIHGLPLEFNDKNILKKIRISNSINRKILRLVFELNHKAQIKSTTRKIEGQYNIIFTINASHAINNSTHHTKNNNKLLYSSYTKKSVFLTPVIVVAIDAGHGGQDPGAIGPNGLNEKNVTIAISKKLKKLLDQNHMFKPVLTREGDYFVSVQGRSDVARRKKASVLISIHADAAPNCSAKGASVWVLSNQRANNEMGNWLEKHEKQSELLGGAGWLLAKNNSKPYLSQVVLDLQFIHSQRVGYDIAIQILNQLQRISVLHKPKPVYASFGVLRSPDIPSLLVETSFISNVKEAQLLATDTYQNKIANALYNGLKSYFSSHPLQSNPNFKRKSQDIRYSSNLLSNNRKIVIKNNTAHLVPKFLHHKIIYGETLFSISRQYGVSIQSLRLLNNLTKDIILVGQQLLIPSNNTSI